MVDHIRLHLMYRSYVIIFIYLLCVNSVDSNSRVKRYLTYPKGSSVVMTMSLLKLMPSGNGLNSMTEFDIFHALPEYTKDTVPNKKKHRRDRRDLFQQLETIIEDGGFDGQSCIRKAICEARSMQVSEDEDNLVKEIFRMIFQPLGNGTYSCRNSIDQHCPFSPLNTVLAWTHHFHTENLKYAV